MTEHTTTITTKSRLRRERLVVLSVLGLLALNYPLLQLFDTTVVWMGIPTIFLYLLLVWAGFIAITAWILESGSSRQAQKPDQQK